MKAEEVVSRARLVAVLCHADPDGDAVGSSLGLAEGIRQLGKACSVVSPDPFPTQYDYLPGFGDVQVGALPLPLPDLLICLDTGSLDRFGKLYADNPEAFSTATILNIDHHPTNTQYGTINLVDPTAAAVTELVYPLLLSLGVEVNAPIATCLLTAILSDSQSFRTPNTTPSTLRIAADLQQAGASLSDLIRRSTGGRPGGDARALGRLLTEVRSEGEIYWVSLTLQQASEVQGTTGMWNGLADVLFWLERAAVVAVFRESEGGVVKVSLRSAGEVNVATVAAAYSGGGHVRASGFCISGSLPEVEREVIGHLRRQLNDERHT